MGGYRLVGEVIILLFAALVLTTGCANSCAPEKSYERTPIVKTVDLYSEEPYTIQETRVTGEKCIEKEYNEMNSSRFSIRMDEKEWVDIPVPGKSNDLRRVVNIFNPNDEIDNVYIDKIYLYNGSEIKRSKHPMMFLVNPKESTRLFVLWHTQYDPLKDVIIDFTNNTEEAGFETRIMRMCYNDTEQVNVTKYRKILTGNKEETEGFKDSVKVRLKRDC